jgi:DNA gyrase inhibitor GyrI
MKKIALILIILFVLATAGIYVFLPAPTNIVQNSLNEVSETNAARFLIWTNNWQKWWPGQRSAADSNLFTYKGVNYHLTKSTNGGTMMVISKGDFSFDGEVSYLAEGNLKIRITWEGLLQGDRHFLKKWSQYQAFKKVNENVGDILKHLKTFLENDKNVYGFNIHLAKIKDPVMLTTATTFHKYPEMNDIDPMLQKLRRVVKEQNGLETNHPMLNIHQVDKNEFEVTAALPINKEIQPKENTTIKKMLLGGNVLVADVKGGRNSINNAFAEVKNFSSDYRLISPAMPFESMVTNRSIEKDTAKWITKIYYPIF